MLFLSFDVFVEAQIKQTPTQEQMASTFEWLSHPTNGRHTYGFGVFWVAFYHLWSRSHNLYTDSDLGVGGGSDQTTAILFVYFQKS